MKHLLIVALCALPLSAFAGPKEAKKHVDAATEAHKQGRYDVALTELQAAYALDPQPELLYAMGQVQVKLDKCADAIVSYEKFLATNPDPDTSAAATEAINTCKAQEPQPEPEPEPEPPPPPEPTPTPPPPPPPPAPEGKPFYTDVLGGALVGGGVVSAAVGVFMYTRALSTLDDAEAATSYDEHQQLVDDAHGKRTLAVVFSAVGAVAVGVGVWRYMQVRSESNVTVTPTASGGVVTWTGRF